MNKSGTRTTKDFVLNCFDKVVFERGALAATLQDGVNAANLTTGVIYHYFEDKLDLLWHLFRRYTERQCQLVESACTVTEALQGLRELGAINPGAARLDFELAANQRFMTERHARRKFITRALNSLASLEPDHPRGITFADGILNLVRSDRLGWSGPADRADLAEHFVTLFNSGKPSPISPEFNPPARNPKAEPIRYFDWNPKPGRLIPTTKHGKKKRKAILKAASDTLASLGRQGLTIAAVANRAGVSTATVYRYFQDTMDIFEALLPGTETALHHARDLVSRDGFDMVAGLHSYISLIKTHRGVWRGWLDIIESDTSQNARFTQSRQDFFNEVTAHFGAGYAGPIESMLLIMEGHVWETIVYGQSTCHDQELADMAARLSP